MTDGTRPLVSLGPTSLHTLRTATERVLGEQAAALLQEAGFASGDEVYAVFQAWLAEQAEVGDPAELDAALLGSMASDFFVAIGWGALALHRMGEAALALDAPGWAEAQDDSAEYPSCHFTTGLLAAFFGHLAADTIAVMEVECRSCGDARCRFLAGAPDTLQAVFDGMTHGEAYAAILTAAPAS